MAMSVQSREKTALIVFAGLILLSLGGFITYILAGHSWNVAASNLDDTFGSMDGYTSIVYEGVVEPVKSSTSSSATGSSATGTGTAGEDTAGSSAAGSGATGLSLDESDAVDSDAAGSGSTGSSAVGSDSAGLSATDSDSTDVDATDTDSASQSAATTNSLAANGEATQDDSANSASPNTTNSSSSSTVKSGETKKTITLAEVQESYEEKGATVFALDTTSLEKYSEGTILKKGGHRFGVFSVTKVTPTRVLEKQVKYFTDHEVDFIVVMTINKAFVEGLEGVDIVLSTQDEELFTMGETKDGTFFVDAPEKGLVGAILISPSNVVSAKTIDSL